MLLCLHVVNMANELGVIAASMVNLFSERRHPQYGSDNHQEQLSIMFVSIATTVMAFALTVLGAGSALSGCKVVAARVSAAGAKVAARVSGGCRVFPTTAPLKSQEGGVPGVHRGVWLGGDRCPCSLPSGARHVQSLDTWRMQGTVSHLARDPLRAKLQQACCRS